MNNIKLTADELYIQLFENESIPKLLTDPESLAIIDANRAAVSFYGYGEDIKRMKITQINALTVEQVKNAIQKAKDAPRIFYFRHRTASGDIRDVEVYTNPVTVKDKIYIQSVIVDITEKNLTYSQLFSSEQKYRQLFKNMSEAFAYCKISNEKNSKARDFEIVEVNDAFENLFNVSAAEIVSDKYMKSSSRLAELVEAVSELLEAETIFGSPDQTCKFFQTLNKWLKIVHFIPVPGYFVLMITDVTSQKLFEKSLSESHQFLKSVFNSLHISLAVLDENGMIIQLNDSWKRHDHNFGLLGPNCRIGMNYFEICDEVKKNSGDDIDLANAAAVVKNSIDDTLSRKNINITDEIGIGNNYFKFTARFFEWPETYRIIIAFEDITCSRKSEEKIKKLSLAVEQSPAAVVITDSEGTIEYVNRKFSSLTGYSFEEAVGNNPRILNSGYHSKEFYSELWRIIKSCGEWRGEFRNKKKDGSLYWEQASITPIVSGSGVITHFVALKEDISVRKTIEEELKKSKEEAVRARLAAEDASVAKSRFLANMSHEIRTPMNSIIGFTDMLASSGLTDEQKELLDYIKTSSGALLSLINDILDLSKIEAGKLEIESVEFDLNSVLEQVIGITRASASKKRIKYSYMLDSAISFKVFSDAFRLRQVVLNLVDNAIKFTGTGKSVKIFISLEGFEKEDAVIKFLVSDEGIGIPADKLDTIFMSFTQSDTSITRKYGGTGLGLTISNHIIKQMGGDGIKVTSVEGRGSDFSFTLNLKKGSSINYEGLKYNVSNGIEGASAHKYDILLVEDNSSNIALTTKILTRSGHNVAIAVNGEQAVKMSQQQKFDLLLMDIQMPVMDGIEATKAIRGRGDAVPIIAMTASAMKGDYEACIEAGMDGYMSKPINIAEINGVINKVLLKAKDKDKDKVKNNKGQAPSKTAAEKPGALPNICEKSLEAKAAAIEKKMQPSSESETKVFDPQKLMFNMGNIKELAIDSVDMFLEYCLPYYQEVKNSVEEKNADKIKRAAHKFKGTSLNACAMKVAAVLLKMEGCAKNGEIKECEILFEELGREIEAYRSEVSMQCNVISEKAFFDLRPHRD